MKVFLLNRLLIPGFLLLLTNCAGMEQHSQPASYPKNETLSVLDNPVAPGNLPPPSQEEVTLQKSSQFFQRKEVWDSFSPSLKQKVLESYSKPSSQKGDTYETLFGKVVIEGKAEVEILEDGKISAQNVEEKGELVSTTLAITGEGTGSCSTGTPFLCISSPRDGQGVVVDVLRVDGAIKMSHQEGERRVDDAAFFGPLDPVAMVSVFKQITNAPLQRVGDFPILPSDLVPVMYRAPRAEGVTEDPPAIEIGPFEKAVPLSGSGVYHVLVSAWKNTETGAVREDKRFIIYRQGIPLFAVNGVKLYPAHRSGNLRCDKEHPITLSSTPVNVTTSDICIETELQEAGTPNVGVVVENYSRNNGELVLNYSGSGEVAVETNPTTHKPIISTLVPLNVGLNHFKVKVQNTLLPGTAPEAALKEFELMNTRPQYSLKFSNASVQDGKVIEARSETENVSIQFCISSNGNTCVADWPEASKPKIFLNGIEMDAGQIRRDASGQYSTSVRPMVGANTFVVQTPSGNGFSVPEYKAAFGFGKVNKLYERGQLKETDSFLKRGLSLEINQSIFTNHIRTLLLNYLNKPEFAQTVRGAFTASDPSFPNDCFEYRGAATDSGTSIIEFTSDPRIGAIEITEFAPRDQNLLAIRISIRDFYVQGNILGAIPIDVQIRRLNIKLGVRFVKSPGSAWHRLDIVALENDANGQPKVIEIEGAQGLNGFIRLATDRSTSASYYQRFQSTLETRFYDTVTRTLLCGVENKLNPPPGFDELHPSSYGLGQWLSDIQKITGYNNQNPFRIPLQFDMLGKQVGVDFAYDVLRAQSIQMSSRGIQIVNVPLRVTPGPVVLAGVPEALRNTLLGSLSAPDRNPEAPATSPETNENHNLSLKFSEEAINQALFAANFAGVLDIKIDPNFFTNNDIPFISPATPTVKDMIGENFPNNSFFDLNQNGVDDDNNLPLQLRLTTNKALAPFIHFLSPEEINTFAQNIENSGNREATPETQVRFNRDLKYFKFTLPDLELGFYRVMPLPDSIKAFCAASQAQKNYYDPEHPDARHPTPQVPSVLIQANSPNGMTRACKQSLSVDYDIPLNGQCAQNFKKVTVPFRNGEVISALSGVPDMPIIKFKGTLTAYGVFLGVYREQTIDEVFTVNSSNGPPTFTENPSPRAKNFLRIKFLPTDSNMRGVIFDLKVAESHIPIQLDSVNLSQIISGAIAGDCQRFNEVRIPIPDKFVEDPAVQGDFMEKLREFGIASLNLGTEASNLPMIAPDTSGLYLDLSAHLGIAYPLLISPEATTNLVIQEILRRQNNSN